MRPFFFPGPVKALDATKCICARLCYLRRRGRLIFVRRVLVELYLVHGDCLAFRSAGASETDQCKFKWMTPEALAKDIVRAGCESVDAHRARCQQHLVCAEASCKLDLQGSLFSGEGELVWPQRKRQRTSRAKEPVGGFAAGRGELCHATREGPQNSWRWLCSQQQRNHVLLLLQRTFGVDVGILWRRVGMDVQVRFQLPFRLSLFSHWFQRGSCV